MLIVIARLLEDAAVGAGLASTRWGRLALIILFVAEAAVMAERWHQPISVEVTGAVSAATFAGARASRLYRRECEDEARRKAAAGPRYGVPPGERATLRRDG